MVAEAGGGGNGGEGLQRRWRGSEAAHVLSIPSLPCVSPLQAPYIFIVGSRSGARRHWREAGEHPHLSHFFSRVLMDVLGPRVSNFSIDFVLQYRVMVAPRLVSGVDEAARFSAHRRCRCGLHRIVLLTSLVGSCPPILSPIRCR
jgi:hypothetical protein